MDLDSSSIQDLAEEINVAIANVVNVDEILDNTRADLATAQNLKDRADRAKERAAGQLKHAQEVTNSLSEASGAQDSADSSIRSAQVDIDSARKDIAEVTSHATLIENHFLIDFLLDFEQDGRGDEVLGQVHVGRP